jgi:hypothetical protein
MASIGFGPYAIRNSSYGSFGSPVPGTEMGQGGGSGGVASKQKSTSKSNQSTFFSDPTLANALGQSAGGVAQGAAGNYLNFINNPTAHPYFTNALGGLLQALIPSEQNARMSLNDQFRAAGNTASSTYGQKAMGLESELMRNRQGVASQLLTSMFPQITQALFAPIGQSSNLMNALKLSQGSSSSNSSGQSFFNPNTGQPGGGGMSFTGFQQGGNPFGFGLDTVRDRAPGYGSIGQPTNFPGSSYVSPDMSFMWEY